MLVNKVITLLFLFGSYVHANEFEPISLNQTLIEYKQKTKECSKYQKLSITTKNEWFNGLSVDEQKTVIYYVMNKLHSNCMEYIENKLIVSFFHDAIESNSTDKLLNFIEMTKIALPSDDFKVILNDKLNQLDSKKLTLFIQEIKD